MGEVRIEVLGPLRVHVDGVEQRLGGRRERAVLALLAAAGGRAVSAERLVDEVWGEDAPASATGSLQVAVSRLRGSLEPDRASGAAPAVLTRGPGGYALERVVRRRRRAQRGRHGRRRARAVGRGGACRRGAGALARRAVRRAGRPADPRRRGHPAPGGPAAAARGARGGPARPRPPRRGPGHAGHARGRPPVPRAAVVAAGGGALPLRPPGRRARDPAPAPHRPGRRARRRPVALGARPRGRPARPGAPPRGARRTRGVGRARGRRDAHASAAAWSVARA